MGLDLAGDLIGERWRPDSLFCLGARGQPTSCIHSRLFTFWGVGLAWIISLPHKCIKGDNRFVCSNWRLTDSSKLCQETDCLGMLLRGIYLEDYINSRSPTRCYRISELASCWIHSCPNVSLQPRTFILEVTLSVLDLFYFRRRDIN